MKKKLLSLCTVIGLTFSLANVALADTPTNPWHFDNRSITFYNDGSNPTYKDFWFTGATRWTNDPQSTITVQTGYRYDFRAGNTENSSATWDGICYTNYNWLTGNISSTRAWVNTYFTTQSRYTIPIISAIATHELGHAVGLGHNDTEASVMLSYTFYSNGTLARTYEYPTPADLHSVNNKYDGYPYGTSLTAKNGESTSEKKGVPSLEKVKNPKNKENVVIIEPSWAYKYDSLKDLADSADLVIEGTVKKKDNMKTTSKKELTEYSTGSSLEIKKILKGDPTLEKKDIVVNQLGGESENTLYYSHHTTQLQDNQNVIIFLKKIGENNYIPINEDDSIFVSTDGSVDKANQTNLSTEGETTYQHLNDQSLLTKSEIISKMK
ncbi:matrixin family metalloprotease [Paenibacillus sp. HWE-109]|uniref:matrixin family metalloprotease n=1 Tax=Paenibacillus sp. HWE-109 TaxID=1306526 RepID=UPI001EDE9954|nr:matrixin family metalloprotease [Paenibacillus sp. HWE-109]UKS26611.1 matrixin family metalloprotease [Paenibacillus sp. HWE-109]